MEPIGLFEFASRRADWLASRQAVVAGNIAHANTPGFKAKDVVPFDKVMDQTQLTMTATDRGHLQSASASGQDNVVRHDRAWEISHSQNSVRLEQELLKAGEVSRDMALNTTVTQAFHRMLLSSLRGQS